MKICLIKISFILGLFVFFSSCKSLENVGINSVKELTHKLDSLTQRNAISELSKNAVEGAISGSTNEVSEEKIKELSEKLGIELNKALQNIDTKNLGSNFSQGVTEKLLSKEVELRLTTLVSEAVSKANGDVSLAINDIETDVEKSLDGIFKNLNSNISSLEKQIINSLSDRLKDSLSFFLTDAIAGIEFDALSERLSTELLSSQLRDTLSSMVIDIKKEIGKQDGTLSPIADYITSAILLIFLLSMLWVWYFFHKKKKDKQIFENDLSDIFQNMVAENAELRESLLAALSKKETLESFRNTIENRGNSGNKK